MENIPYLREVLYNHVVIFHNYAPVFVHFDMNPRLLKTTRGILKCIKTKCDDFFFQRIAEAFFIIMMKILNTINKRIIIVNYVE